MRLSRRDMLALGGAVAMTGAAAPQPSLNQLAKAKGMLFGNAVGMGRPFRDPRYRALTAAQCGIVVPENELKLYAVKGASPDGFNFAPADELLGFARQNGLKMRGHTLLWNRNEFTPRWLTPAYDFGGRAAAEKWLTNYVQTVAGRYADDLQSWDVVNETIDPKTGEIRDTVFTRAIGPEVIELAFHAAKQAAPKAKLVYNDYMGHAAKDAKHRAGVLKLLHQLKARNVPIDALGVQSHIGNGDSDTHLRFAGAEAREWRRFIDEVRGMGLDLVITEFDVNDVDAPAAIPARDAEVAAVTRAYLDMMVSYPELKQILAWGLVDKYSWLQEYWPRKDKLEKRGTPYDSHFRAKPMREAIAAALRTAPKRRAWA